MTQSIDQIICRGESIESLLDRTEDLEMSSKVFYKNSDKLNRGVLRSVSDGISGMFSGISSMLWSDTSPATTVNPSPLYEASNNNNNNFLMDNSMASSTVSYSTTSSASSSSSSSKQRPVDKIVALQQFNGCWHLNKELSNVVQIDLEFMRNSKKEDVDDVMWGTAIAIAYLENKLKESKIEWEFIVKKARKFLGESNISLIEEAKEAFFNK